jgi:hypothetical protein
VSDVDNGTRWFDGENPTRITFLFDACLVYFPRLGFFRPHHAIRTNAPTKNQKLPEADIVTTEWNRKALSITERKKEFSQRAGKNRPTVRKYKRDIYIHTTTTEVTGHASAHKQTRDCVITRLQNQRNKRRKTRRFLVCEFQSTAAVCPHHLFVSKRLQQPPNKVKEWPITAHKDVYICTIIAHCVTRGRGS